MGIKTRFCPVCGKERGRFVDRVCIDCYFKSLEIKLPKKIELLACPACDAVRVKGFWVRSGESHRAFLIQAVIDRLKLPQDAELEDVEILQEGKEGEVQLNLSIKGKQFSVVKPVQLYIADRLCDEDSRKRRRAYEAILQLRADRDIHRFMQKRILQPFADRIVRVEEIKKGIDVYFLDADSARKALQELKKHFTLQTKESAKAYSWEKMKGKPRYKITILARLK